MNSFVEKRQPTNLVSSKSLWSRLRRNPETRTRFVESHLSKTLALQIRILREQTRWSQEELARRVGMNQNAISRLEHPGYGKATITTLKRIASAFDVALVVRFQPFSQLVDWVSGTPFWEKGLSSESLGVLNFAEENQTREQSSAALGPISYKAINRTAELGLGRIDPSQLELRQRTAA
jgi:transcriptional regulator with XRE-family HTH domain